MSVYPIAQAKGISYVGGGIDALCALTSALQDVRGPVVVGHVFQAPSVSGQAGSKSRLRPLSARNRRALTWAEDLTEGDGLVLGQDHSRQQ